MSRNTIYHTTFTNQNLLDSIHKILSESPQSNVGQTPMWDSNISKVIKTASKIQNIPHKPTTEDAIANRNDPVWQNIHNINGSSMLENHDPKEPLKMEHLFYKTKEHKWEYGVKEKIDRDLNNPNEKVHTIFNAHHFVQRVSDPERNYKKLNGKDIIDFKKRVIDKINELGLVGQITHGLEYKQHSFLSTTNPTTKGFSIATRIHPSGKVDIVTLLDPTMQEKEGPRNTLIEEYHHEFSEID